MLVSGAQQVQCEYDYMGKGIKKLIWTYINTSWKVTQANPLVHDGRNLVREVQIGSIPQTKLYVWRLDLRGTQQGAGGISGLLAWTTRCRVHS